MNKGSWERETERGIENMNHKFLLVDKISSFGKTTTWVAWQCALCDASVNKQWFYDFWLSRIKRNKKHYTLC